MAKKYFAEAMQEAIREQMLADPRVIVMGEDVKVSPYGYTRGLYEEFPERVRNTPIAEQTTVGATLGAAMCGLRPITDLMMGNFFYNGMDQLANQVAKLRYMTGGQFTVPAVFISTYGGGGNIAAQHSDTPYAMMMNLAGVKIVVPSTPYDAKGLLKTALLEDNPVVFLAPVQMMGTKEEIPAEAYQIPFGKADIKLEGTDITIVAIGSMVKKALAAAKILKKENISVEVIDPLTLLPFDSITVLDSVAKTGHLVIVDEAREICSAASEISAIVSQHGFRSLKAPIIRVASKNVPIPFSAPLEDYVIPSVERIVDAVHQVFDY